MEPKLMNFCQEGVCSFNNELKNKPNPHYNLAPRLCRQL